MSSALATSTRKSLFVLVVVLACCLGVCSGADTITFTSPIRDSDSESDIVVSSGKTFRLGFFSPENSTNRYVGIMFDIPGTTAIWVANRDRPLKDRKGVFSISGNGNLVVLDGQKGILWSSNASSPVANSTARLSDTGNLVLTDSSNGRMIWDSFQTPGDCLVAKMRLSDGTSEKLELSSWKSPSDPSVGRFRAGLNLSPLLQFLIWEGDSKILWRSGPWNGNAFIGVPGMAGAYQNRLDLSEDKSGSKYYIFNSVNNPVLFFYKLNSSGALQSEVSPSRGNWNATWSSQKSQCDFYGKCGPFGSCNPRSKDMCTCLPGYAPKDDVEWKKGNWNSGCVRKSQWLLQCEQNQSADPKPKQDGFMKLSHMKVPDFAYPIAVTSEGLCGDLCMKNCSCTSFAFYTGIGCMHWGGSLIDVQQFSYDGADLHIRLPYSELDYKGKKKNTTAIIAAIITVASLLIMVCAFICWKRLMKHKGKDIADNIPFVGSGVGQRVESFVSNSLDVSKFEELPLYSYEELASATNNFGLENKLGTGGFGPVYMGKLFDGHQIAVKRLSQTSGQGNEEFMNEVMVISKLQHRNLVKLLGCCVERDEKMLVYEYMANRSLDIYLFDSSKSSLLDWRKRVVIVEGICRGLLYLHRDSRLKIIHRDLKASNILLDEELKPKISDFGMARIFGGNEDQANTTRVVGTYGYMAPEYAMEGRFSEKSDVYSLGVLLLEIVSGRRNTTFYHEENEMNLLRYAWKLWDEYQAANLTEKAISDPANEVEILRYVNVGLLCVQEFANDRPDVSAVLSMLNSEIAVLPPPSFPAYTERTAFSDRTGSSQGAYSLNNFSITMVEGR